MNLNFEIYTQCKRFSVAGKTSKLLPKMHIEVAQQFSVMYGL